MNSLKTLYYDYLKNLLNEINLMLGGILVKNF